MINLNIKVTWFTTTYGLIYVRDYIGFLHFSMS